MTLQMRSISTIYPNPDQPRKTFAAQPLHELAASIQENGLLQPIQITQDGMIIAGERRWRACQIAGKTHLTRQEYQIVKDDTAQRVSILSLVENLQREDVDPYEEAQAMQRAMDEGHATGKKDLAKQLGVSVTYVSTRLRLISLIPEARAALDAGEITQLAAWYVADLKPEDQATFIKMSKSRTLDTTEKVKALIRVILEPPAEQVGLGFDIEDPAVVREFLKLQKAVKTPAQDLTAIALDESALDNIRQMTPGRAEELANLLDSIADTAKALKRVALEAQMA